MPKPVHECNGLDSLSEAHLVSQDDVRSSAPVVREEINTLQLERAELAVLYVVRLFIKFDKFLASGKLGFLFIGPGQFRGSIKVAVDLGL